MPSILLFAPCQKAIINQEDKSVSLIGVINGLSMVPPISAVEPLSATTFAPIGWAAVAVWLKVPGDDENTVFEQRLEVFGPNAGESLATAQTPFRMTHRTHQIAMSGDAFPVGIPGEYNLVLSLRVISADEWREIARYPVEITHVVPASE